MSAVIVHPMSWEVGFYILGMLLLLLASALISGSEVGLFSLSPQQLDQLEKDESRNSKTALELLSDPESLLGTILIANNFVNVGIVLLSTLVLDGLLDFGQDTVLSFLVQVVVVTFLILLFGEIMPKVYANQRAMRFALLMAIPLGVLSRLFRPLVFLLVGSTSFVQRVVVRRGRDFSLDDLSEALDLTSAQLQDEGKLLSEIVRFGNTVAKGIMKPRVDVTAAEMGTSFQQLLAEIVDSGYSRIPVYEDTFDQVKGILYVKDLLPFLDKADDFVWHSLLRPPYFVPENKMISDLMQEFQSKKIHMAIVVDEYGGTSGIVTMEDILEEVVGEIKDEFDQEESYYTKLDDKTFLFDGKTSLKDFLKVTGLPDDYLDHDRGEAETLAGLILEISGDFPKKNQTISLRSFLFTITSIDSRRIAQIKARLN